MYILLRTRFMLGSSRSSSVTITELPQSFLLLDYRAIVHPEFFRSNAQNANTFARRNWPRVERNDEFACVYLRSFACVRLRVLFAIDRVRIRTCVRVRICACVRVHVRI